MSVKPDMVLWMEVTAASPQSLVPGVNEDEVGDDIESLTAVTLEA